MPVLARAGGERGGRQIPGLLEQIDVRVAVAAVAAAHERDLPVFPGNTASAALGRDSAATTDTAQMLHLARPPIVASPFDSNSRWPPYRVAAAIPTFSDPRATSPRACT